MKVGKMLFGATAGFGLGLARAWGDANDEARSKAPQWIKNLAGYKGKPEAIKTVAEVSPPIQQAAEEVKTPSVEPGAGVDPDGTMQQRGDATTIPDAGMDAQAYEDHWKSGEPATPSYPDNGQTANVEVIPMADVELPSFEQTSADLGMADTYS